MSQEFDNLIEEIVQDSEEIASENSQEILNVYNANMEGHKLKMIAWDNK